jgi:hypothetical protein
VRDVTIYGEEFQNGTRGLKGALDRVLATRPSKGRSSTGLSASYRGRAALERRVRGPKKMEPSPVGTAEDDRVASSDVEEQLLSAASEPEKSGAPCFYYKLPAKTAGNHPFAPTLT